MKTTFTFSFFSKTVLITLCLNTIYLIAFCQPDYDFTSSTLISGTNNQIGAVYLFANTKPGVDATVTVINMTGGVILNKIDGPNGYKEALQPLIDVPPFASGYVEFEVNFFVAGTNTPMIQTEVPATSIDVDGDTYSDGSVNEFDALQLTNGYLDYDMLAADMNVNITNPWVTGTNIATIDYFQIDTTPRQVMFTTVNAGISKFSFRTGTISNASNWKTRMRSIYFKKFKYPNSFLSKSALTAFNGIKKDNAIELKWNISENNLLNKIFIEKATNAINFSSIAQVWLNTENNKVGGYEFKDAGLQGNVYYRLKMISNSGQVTYSNILAFGTDNNKTEPFKVYPAVINQNATVSIASDKIEQTALSLYDLNGHKVYQKSITLQKGRNTIMINDFSNITHGTYVAVIKTGNKINNQKIIIQ